MDVAVGVRGGMASDGRIGGGAASAWAALQPSIRDDGDTVPAIGDTLKVLTGMGTQGTQEEDAPTPRSRRGVKTNPGTTFTSNVPMGEKEARDRGKGGVKYQESWGRGVLWSGRRANYPSRVRPRAGMTQGMGLKSGRTVKRTRGGPFNRRRMDSPSCVYPRAGQD